MMAVATMLVLLATRWCRRCASGSALAACTPVVPCPWRPSRLAGRASEGGRGQLLTKSYDLPTHFTCAVEGGRGWHLQGARQHGLVAQRHGQHRAGVGRGARIVGISFTARRATNTHAHTRARARNATHTCPLASSGPPAPCPLEPGDRDRRRDPLHFFGVLPPHFQCRPGGSEWGGGACWEACACRLGD